MHCHSRTQRGSIKAKSHILVEWLFLSGSLVEGLHIKLEICIKVQISKLIHSYIWKCVYMCVSYHMSVYTLFCLKCLMAHGGGIITIVVEVVTNPMPLLLSGPEHAMYNCILYHLSLKKYFRYKVQNVFVR